VKKPKVFQGLVNYGTQSGLFARELRELGFESISVTFFDSFKRVTDIELKHGGNIFQKLYRHFCNMVFLIKCLFKYDIFHFYYGGTLFPGQLDLPLYKLLKKKVIMEYLGNDIQGYDKSIEKYKWTNVNYMMTPEQGKVYDFKIKKRYQFEQKYINLELVCAPVYTEFTCKAKTLPLAVDINKFKYTNMPEFNGVFKIMHAPTHRGFKGTDFIEMAVNKLIENNYPIEWEIVEKVSHDVLLEKYQQCHLFIDQIMGGWYGTATIEAMAIGRPVVVSIREEYYQHIDYGNLIPAIHANPDIIYDVIKETLDRGYDNLVETGYKSRQFVEEIHDVKKVTKQLVNIYNNL
jgi:hypothetical protein